MSTGYTPITLSSGEVLTECEYKVFLLLACGYYRQAVADRLVVTIHTVETHRQSIYHKGRFTCRSALTVEALRLGVLTVEAHDVLMRR